MGSSSENSKYKLLGFENNKNLAVVMIVSTGKVIKIKLGDLMKSEVIDDFSRAEIKNVYRKFYSGGGALTAYEISDRHERSWMTYVALNLMLFALYVFTNVAAAKLVYLQYFDVVVTPGVFLYPLTFLIVDLLNESYGLRLARRAIFFAFASNAFILVLLTVTGHLPGLPGWQLDGPYGEVITHVSSALVGRSQGASATPDVRCCHVYPIQTLEYPGTRHHYGDAISTTDTASYRRFAGPSPQHH